ncbi:MAG: DnaJ domain-containing protein [Methyloprofundus sp.]|nr:DnaJ domain-containing protein [Methyloprofundus sp.]
MQTPYQILGVATDADDAAIKQAYLQQVKINPPDRDAEKFQKIHDAYTAIKDHQSRVSHELFTLPQVDFNSLLAQIIHTEQEINLDAVVLKKILSIAVEDVSLLHKIANAD